MTILAKDNWKIRKYRPSDLAPLVSQFSHPTVLRNIRGVVSAYGMRDGRNFLDLAKKSTINQRGQGKLFYAIEIDGEFAGGIGIEGYGHKAEIGYWIAKKWWGQGIMTKLNHDFTEYAFKKYGLKRIEGKVFPWNKGSIRVLEKNGFQFEGRLRKNHKAGGKYLDDLLYAKIRP